MAVGSSSRKVSAASARAHTRKSNPTSPLFSGLFSKLLLVALVGFFAFAYQAARPPPPKICGTPNGPPITAPRIKLADGRHLAYKEHGVPRHDAKYKFVYIHGFDSSRHYAVVANLLSPDLYQSLGIYIVSFDRPGYGESDPNPARTLKSMASDVEELADELGLGTKFYVIGFSLGGQSMYSCLRYIPHRLAGVTLIAPVVNYWWPSFPSNLSSQAFNKQLPRDIWSLRVAHYLPWLTYWWNTQKHFPPRLSVIAQIPDILSPHDKQVLAEAGEKKDATCVRQQGEFESVHRDLIVGFGRWEFDPTELKNPFPNNEGSVHLWQGDEDVLVPVTLQRHIAQNLPWIQYHEIAGAGHMFAYGKGMSDRIIKAQLSVE